MCGITGIFNLNKPQFDSKALDYLSSVSKSISHRGTDQVSIEDYSSCTILFNRLAITNLSSNQPGGEDWIVYLNGEIYNYKELCYSGSECEVISKGLYEHGPDFVTKLNGMFVIVAIKGKDTWIFRDRYGIKPLYYSTRKDGSIIFSSEIKPLIVDTSIINHEVEEQWLTFNNVFTDETLFSGVKKLEKGTYWHLNTNTKVKYWEWQFTPTHIDYDFAKSEVRRLVIQAINRQTPTEVEYGSCLSGGIDSNIIYRVLGEDTLTYTASFPLGVDESKLLDLKPNNRIRVFTDIEFFNETIYHLEDLRVGASWSNYGLYQLASTEVKVLFDGAGADELFGGYRWRYLAEDYYEVVNRTGRASSVSREVFSKVFKQDTLENRFKFDADYFLEGVLLVCDRLSMAHTIEMRVPFLDNDLVDFCLTLPNEYKKDKKILKEAFSYLLPNTILTAKKHGFSSPDLFKGEGNQAEKWSKAALEKWKYFYDNRYL